MFITGNKGAVEFSVLFPNDEQDEKQQGYIGRLMDYFDEMQRYSPAVKGSVAFSGANKRTRVSSLDAGSRQRLT